MYAGGQLYVNLRCMLLLVCMLTVCDIVCGSCMVVWNVNGVHDGQDRRQGSAAGAASVGRTTRLWEDFPEAIPGRIPDGNPLGTG